MPLPRKMLAADSFKAEQLSKIASKRGSTLFSYTNKLIDAAILIDMSGYEDPKEAASDIAIITSMMASGFRLCLPRVDETSQWRTIGETLGHLIKTRLGEVEPLRVMYSVFTLILGKKSVFFQEVEGKIALIITIPVDSQLTLKQAKLLAEGLLNVLSGEKAPLIQQRANLLIIRAPS